MWNYSGLKVDNISHTKPLVGAFFLSFFCLFLFFFSREQLLCLELTSDRNLAGPPEGCFSVETEIQTATSWVLMVEVRKHTIWEQERRRLLSPLSFGDLVQGLRVWETAFFPLLRSFNVIPNHSCPGNSAWERGLSSHFFFPLSLSAFLACSLYLLPSAPSPIPSFMALPVTIHISSLNFFIPAVQLHFLALTPLRLFVARAREWCPSYSTLQLNWQSLDRRRHAAIPASSAAWAVAAHALLLAHSS